MTTDEFFEMIDAHERKAGQKSADYRKARRLGDLYQEVHDLINLCNVHRAIVRNDVTKLVARYGEEDVRWVMGVIKEDMQYAKR